MTYCQAQVRDGRKDVRRLRPAGVMRTAGVGGIPRKVEFNSPVSLLTFGSSFTIPVSCGCAARTFSRPWAAAGCPQCGIARSIPVPFSQSAAPAAARTLSAGQPQMGAHGSAFNACKTHGPTDELAWRRLRTCEWTAFWTTRSGPWVVAARAAEEPIACRRATRRSLPAAAARNLPRLPSSSFF